MRRNIEEIKIELDKVGRTYTAVFGSFIGFFSSILLAGLFGKVDEIHFILIFPVGLWVAVAIYYAFDYRYEVLMDKVRS